MAHTLGEIAKITGAKLDGDPKRIVNRASSLQFAKPDEISFLANKRHVKYLKNSAAGAIILSPGNKHRCSVETLVCDDPYLAFAITLRHMQPDFSFTAGIHPAASISQHASISNSSYSSSCGSRRSEFFLDITSAGILDLKNDSTPSAGS